MGSAAVEGRKGKMTRKESLLWLRDELKKLKQTDGARHDLAAGLIHLYAETNRFWQPSSAPEHQVYIVTRSRCAKTKSTRGSLVRVAVAIKSSPEWRKRIARDFLRRRCCSGTSKRWPTRRSTSPRIVGVT